MKKIIASILAVVALAACDPASPNSDQVQRRQQEQLSAQATSSVGMPAITNFQEKRMMKMILELRDTAVTTVTYTRDMNGKLHKVCNSIGYGLPYATQYTNPQRVAGLTETPERGNITLPQADPNGLFSPASAEGTWVMCQNPKNKDQVMPVYIEDRVTVSPFELE